MTQQPKDKSGVWVEWVEATQEYAAYAEGPLGFKWMIFSVSPERARDLHRQLGELLGMCSDTTCEAEYPYKHCMRCGNTQPWEDKP